MRNDKLIIDVGMHTGEDTAFYLAKGFDVVAIEANPALVQAAEKRFAAELADGRLRIVDSAIAETRGTLPLAVAEEDALLTSLSPSVAMHRERSWGTRYHTVEVSTVPFEDILREVGIPYYLKVDIEGLDMLCVKALHQFTDRPRFISLESNVSDHAPSFGKMFDEIAHLWTLGYRDFKYVDQQRHPERHVPRPPREGLYADAAFTTHSSGPFGEEAPGKWRPIGSTLARTEALWLDARLGGRWSQTRRARAYRGFRRAVMHRRTGWYDLHARLGV